MEYSDTSQSRVTGPFGLVDMETVREHRGWFFALGLGFMLLGMLALFLPFAASLVTAVFLGWLMILGGLFQGFHAIQNRRWKGWGWELVAAVLYLVAGGLVVARPMTGTLTLTLVFAAFFVAEGILKIIRAVQHRAMPRWGWLLFDGIVSLALGVLIVAGWPGTGTWALGILVGVDLLVGGSSMMMIGLGAGSFAQPRTAGAHP